MSNTLSAAFTQQYHDQVLIEYQRMGSKLRGTVYTQPLNGAKNVEFFVMGSVEATLKSTDPAALVKTSGAPSRTVVVTPKDYEWGDWVGTIDEKKTTRDYKAKLARMGAAAMGRTTDKLIVAAANQTTVTTTGAGNLADTAAINIDKALKVQELLNAAEVPDDGNRYVIVNSAGWSQLMKIDQFVRSEYVGEANLPYQGGTAKKWLGMNWVMANVIGMDSTVAQGLAYHRDAIGLVDIVRDDTSINIEWGGPSGRHSYFVSGMMSTDAAILHPTGVVQLRYTPTA